MDTAYSRNPAHRIFLELHEQFNRDAGSLRVDVLCAELAAQIAAEPYALLLGIFEAKELRKVYGLVYALSEYGVTLRTKMRSDKRMFIYGEIEVPRPVQFVGAIVEARRAVVRRAA